MTEVHGNRRGAWGCSVEEGKVWGGIVTIWLGVSFLLKEMSYISVSMWWPVFAVGLGVLLILRSLNVYQIEGYWGKGTANLVRARK
jgi:hypothetical protein